jgi:hypothetical protein
MLHSTLPPDPVLPLRLARKLQLLLERIDVLSDIHPGMPSPRSGKHL